MPFHKVVSSAHPKPHVIYFHTTGYEKAFGAGESGVHEGAEYARRILSRHSHLIAPADFILGAIWGDEDIPVAELHGYSELAGD